MKPLSATEAVAAIAAGTLTSEKLVRDCLERIAERESVVKAWAFLNPDLAIAQAKAADVIGEGVLCGVPIGVKDIIDTRDLPTERGSVIYRGTRVPWNAACVALAERAGGVVLGKTVTTELAYFEPGPTTNPHAPAHTPGGSSSGSAAAVADFMVPLAFGTQTAGSLTRPASYCGVVGYKPSFGEFPLAGIKPFAPSLDTLGVLSRHVEDAALMRAVMLGLPHQATQPNHFPPVRVGFCRTPWWTEGEAYARAGLELVVARLAQTAIPVGQVTLPSSCDRLVQAQKIIMAFEAAANLAFEYEAHGERLSTALRDLIEAGLHVARDEYLLNLSVAACARRELAGVFEEWDVLLVPAAHGEAPAGLDATGDPLFSRAWTLLGLPTLTLPAFHGPHGLPVGLQLVAARGADFRLLQAARCIQSVLGLAQLAASPHATPEAFHA